MDEFEEAIKEFNQTIQILEKGLGDCIRETLEASHTTAVNAIKSEEGKKAFCHTKSLSSLKAKLKPFLNGESPKTSTRSTTAPQPDPQPAKDYNTDLTVKEPPLRIFQSE